MPFGDEFRAGTGGRTARGYLSSGATPGVSSLFTGRYRDTELASSAMPSGLDYFRARHYAPAFGRFMQPDPLNMGASTEFPQAWHGYNYVANNPLVNTDPLGLFCPSTGCEAPAPDPSPGIIIDPCWLFPGLCWSLPGNQQAEATPPPPPPPPQPVRVPANEAKTANNGKSIADIARCAAQKANSASLAALLPQGTPSIVSNILGNDFSSISNLITGPGRLNEAVGIAEGKALNTAVRAVGAIPYGADRFILGTNGAGTTFARDMIPGTIANSAAGALAGNILTKLSTAKLVYDAATYAGAAAICYASQN